ncbi:MAG: N-acetyl-gamma-glutamyl-phosphate reductase [Alphaproteobacteria bacterium]|nr:N-acetyl-gamma-glutamyl-phosphate reductase [Alphaproteobacteria bacterium]
MSKPLKASIVGVTGYTGLELLRILLAHPHVEIAYLTSRQHENDPVGSVYPHLAGYDLAISNTDLETVAKDSDVVFLCLPHKTSQETVASLYGKTKIIDLSADFRLDDPAVYERTYGLKHEYPEILKEAIYGAPEWNKDKIAKADLVANPGCFALLSQILLYPFAGHIKSADIFAVTGSSGAGKSPVEGTHHPVRNHNLKSYNINKHRHIPEIIRTAQMDENQLNFVPSSGPFTRGIFAQAFITPERTVSLDVAEKAYAHAPFVRLQNEVALANVTGSNFVDISYTQGQDGRIIAQGVLDNLVKGAAGCAVQNMNIMFGLEETLGLKTLSPLYP